MLPDVAKRMGDPARRDGLLHVARALETEPFVLGTSVHLMAVAQLPTEAHGETP